MINVKIPWRYVVSKNRKYTIWRGGKLALSKEYRDCKDAIHTLSKLQMSEQGVKLPTTDRVGVRLDVYAPDKRHYDIFNVTQIILDGVEGAAYDDDWQIDFGEVQRCPIDRDNPRVEIHIWELDDAD